METSETLNLLTSIFTRVSVTFIKAVPIHDVAETVDFMGQSSVVMCCPANISIDHRPCSVTVPASNAFKQICLVVHVACSGTLRNENKAA